MFWLLLLWLRGISCALSINAERDLELNAIRPLCRGLLSIKPLKVLIGSGSWGRERVSRMARKAKELWRGGGTEGKEKERGVSERHVYS